MSKAFDIDDNADEIYRMEMPCECVCGKWFDLHDGHGCDHCKQVFCVECVPEPFGVCENCKILNEENDDE